jgi:hypothetical protein
VPSIETLVTRPTIAVQASNAAARAILRDDAVQTIREVNLLLAPELHPVPACTRLDTACALEPEEGATALQVLHDRFPDVVPVAVKAGTKLGEDVDCALLRVA